MLVFSGAFSRSLLVVLPELLPNPFAGILICVVVYAVGSGLIEVLCSPIVEACPTDAMMFGEEEDLQDYIEGATVMQPETGSAPRLYYRNIPGQFIAGTVYDPVEKEVVIGARCLLNSGGKRWEVRTDEYGDFWFNDLPVGLFDLVIQDKADRYLCDVPMGTAIRAGANHDVPCLSFCAAVSKNSAPGSASIWATSPWSGKRRRNRGSSN